MILFAKVLFVIERIFFTFLNRIKVECCEVTKFISNFIIVFLPHFTVVLFRLLFGRGTMYVYISSCRYNIVAALD